AVRAVGRLHRRDVRSGDRDDVDAVLPDLVAGLRRHRGVRLLRPREARRASGSLTTRVPRTTPESVHTDVTDSTLGRHVALTACRHDPRTAATPRRAGRRGDTP